MVDWLSYTAPDDAKIDDCIPPLDQRPDWIDLERGALGYKAGMAWGSVKLYFDGTPGMGKHVTMSGDGCRQVEGHGVNDWSGFLRWIIDMGYQITRLDLAIDERKGLLSLDTMRDHLAKGEVSSRWRQYCDITSHSIGWAGAGRRSRPIGGRSRGLREGTTLYVGSGQSDARLRVYDKAAESGSTSGEPWVRVEVQFRDVRARAMASALTGPDGLAIFCNVLRGYIDFKQPGEDTNRSRWLTVDWWLIFLGDVQKLRLSVPKTLRTLDDVRVWLERQVAPALALLWASRGCDEMALVELAIEGHKRWGRRHKRLIAGLAA